MTTIQWNKVIQADRDLAASIEWIALGYTKGDGRGHSDGYWIKRGQFDDNKYVQLFAAHRLNNATCDSDASEAQDSLTGLAPSGVAARAARHRPCPGCENAACRRSGCMGLPYKPKGK